MSDYSEVLYDPDAHTHASCLRDVENADVMVLLIGSRFGGAAVSQALTQLDLDKVLISSGSASILSEKDKISITQAEVLKAVQLQKPIFSFVDSRVYADHHLYQKNKDSDIIGKIKFPSIDKPETARSIFDFISFITHRSYNNSIIPYRGFAEIEDHLLKQWSLLLQRLLQERRENIEDSRRSDAVLSKLDDIRAVILQSIPGRNEKEVARSVLKYRRIVEFLLVWRSINSGLDIYEEELDFPSLLIANGLNHLDVSDITRSPYRLFFVLDDESFFGARLKATELNTLEKEWDEFKQCQKAVKEAVVDGVSEAFSGTRLLEYHPEDLNTYRDFLETAEEPTSDLLKANRSRGEQPTEAASDPLQAPRRSVRRKRRTAKP